MTKFQYVIEDIDSTSTGGIINSDDWYEKNTLMNISNYYLDGNFNKILHGSLNYIYNNKNFFTSKSPDKLSNLKKNI